MIKEKSGWKLFKDKKLFVAGGTKAFRRRFCDNALKRYPEMSGLIVLVGNKKEYEREIEANKNPLVTIRQVNFLQKKSLLKELEGGDYLLYKHNTGENTQIRKAGSYIKQNICRVQNLAGASAASGLKKAIFINSDKVCNPVDLTGALSLCLEKLWIANNTDSNDKKKTGFSAVRLSGMTETMYSDIDLLFKSRDKGSLTIIDRQATRFWITPHEGIAFILKCFAKIEGGEVFVPKTPSISLKMLAQIICPECQLKETGITSGDKLHETLIDAEESDRVLEYNDYYIVQPECRWWNSKRYGEKTGGREAAPGFSYSSDTNSWVLSLDELEFIIKRVISKEIVKSRILV